MNHLDNTKLAWLSGGSTGIGRALTLALTRLGISVIISARNSKALDAVVEEAQEKGCSGSVIPLPLDVTDAAAVANAAASIEQQHGALDLVILNAGTCEYLDASDLDLEAGRRVMETNFWGAANITRAALPLLRQSPQPKLAYVSSSVTYAPLPRASAYGASKAAMRYFAESLKVDLQAEGIDVAIVSPGFVETPLTDQNDFPMPMRVTATRAAETIVKGLQKGTHDIHFPKGFTLMLKLISLLPSRLRFPLLANLSRNETNPPTKPEKPASGSTV